MLSTLLDKYDKDKCGWDGTVNHILMSNSDSDFKLDSNTDLDTDFEVLDLKGEELLESLGLCIEKELELLSTPTPYEKIQKNAAHQWDKAKKNCCLSYNGLSAHTQCWQNQKAQAKEQSDTVLCATMMQSFLKSKLKLPCQSQSLASESLPYIGTSTNLLPMVTPVFFTGYLSDLSDSDVELTDDDVDTNHGSVPLLTAQSPLPIQQPPSLKRQQLKVPACVAHQQAKNNHQIEREQALRDIKKLIQSKRELFDGDTMDCSHIMQEPYRARAAESQGFAEKWVDKQELPVLSKGQHKKTFSLKQEMIPKAAEQYLQHITTVKMPQGLKKYLEIELFPQIQQKPSGGVSLSTAHCLLKQEGFQFQEYKKALYYDGHEWPDVVEDRQTCFLLNMAKLKERVIEYVVGDVDQELVKTPSNYVERWLVLCAHDKMTAQTNNDMGKG
ncbi:uncharacterized protein EDB91DRAFT_1256057 [Suillus paluster]|uniref:uncharacterized protein n=1 Tax=Suillus paluster TaxID=48578 RepID=UPI001B8728EB|nr:uncharacterized protein EDB91DRAFT_1256057 [Suillus paluster]KAG1722436.1 hypothetical protein EDB91DRAFT_1256057 [Suillus paluster]